MNFSGWNLDTLALRGGNQFRSCGSSWRTVKTAQSSCSPLSRFSFVILLSAPDNSSSASVTWLTEHLTSKKRLQGGLDVHSPLIWTSTEGTMLQTQSWPLPLQPTPFGALSCRGRGGETDRVVCSLPAVQRKCQWRPLEPFSQASSWIPRRESSWCHGGQRNCLAEPSWFLTHKLSSKISERHLIIIKKKVSNRIC